MYSFFPCCCAKGILTDTTFQTDGGSGFINTTQNMARWVNGVAFGAGPSFTVGGGSPQGFGGNGIFRMDKAVGKVFAGRTGGGAGIPSLYRREAGTTWSALIPPLTHSTSVCEANGDIVVVGGGLSTAPFNSVFRSTDMVNWTALPGLRYPPISVPILLQNQMPIVRFHRNSIYVAGCFQITGLGSTLFNLAKWSGTTWQPITGLGTPARAFFGGLEGDANVVNAMESDGNILYLGGTFRPDFGSNLGYMAAIIPATPTPQPIGGFVNTSLSTYAKISSIALFQTKFNARSDTAAFGVDVGPTDTKLRALAVTWGGGGQTNPIGDRPQGLWAASYGVTSLLLQADVPGQIVVGSAPDMLGDNQTLYIADRGIGPKQYTQATGIVQLPLPANQRWANAAFGNPQSGNKALASI